MRAGAPAKRRMYCPANGHDITGLSGQEVFDHILLENGEIPA